ncbi:MAG: hypothetical protein A3E38_02905 [Candidatus Moranbacteria bacterium RIFCSPHIGHO2_12_FULL_54_9]|nr:MAG: hypothetical protein A2878_03635 [Candidatus Moranbacteria bacterium RIFCSPHIGHO2_01_FULL_54_31]OGI25822.1 MAG: hypothetical protein A3E38_02905 [Candidatus Moranbacteria bacterium RIFCSPHIGHO2_12_FULL_54_9]
MQEQAVIDVQLEFFKKGGAGCLFAAYAARDPVKFGWRLSVSEIEKTQIENLVQSAVSLEDVSTQSLIFPSVIKWDDLENLLSVLKETSIFSLEQKEEFCGTMCLGYRVQVGVWKSWVTGFGSFDFLPKTRQAVFTEITFRVKLKPEYVKVMKEAPLGILHLADMDMQGMGENKFKSLWYGSLDAAEKIIGHKPDLRSAAKTTFAVPLDLWKE